MSNFASRFNLALETKGISRRELARLSGVHVNTLNNWASGTVPNPHPRQLQKVASFLGVAYEWLRIGATPVMESPLARSTARDSQGVAERVLPGEGYATGGELSFDPELMEQIVGLVEDYLRLFRRRLDEFQRVELMEQAYQTCVGAGLTGKHEISMSQFHALLKGIR